jgi:hypothetical protein
VYPFLFLIFFDLFTLITFVEELELRSFSSYIFQNYSTLLPLGTEEYSLAQHVFKLVKPGYMFLLYSHHLAYLQSLVELYMLNAYAVWDPSSEANIFTDGVKNMNHSVS